MQVLRNSLSVTLLAMAANITLAPLVANAAPTETCPPAIARPEPRKAAEKASGKADFALDLLVGLSSQPAANFDVSPFGIAQVLSGLELGADDKMRAALAQTLRLNPKRAAEGFEGLRKEARLMGVAASAADSPLRTGDSVLVDKAVNLPAGIADTVKAETGIVVQVVDFGNAEAVTAVNEWVSERTRGRIKDIVDPADRPALAVINAFSFKGCWRLPFDPEKTEPKPFKTVDGKSVNVSTMVLANAKVYVRKKRDFVGVELPYSDDRYVMNIVTTAKAPAALAAFRGAQDALEGVGYSEEEATVMLPKFKGEGSRELLPLLAKLGLEPGLASTTQLAGFGSGQKLSIIRQKTFIAVDESGTEAAAATAAMTNRAIAPQQQLIAFDKPFMYALRHRQTGIVIMAGYVGVPNGQ